MFGSILIGVGVDFVKINAIFEIQIPRYWLHRRNDPIFGPSKFPSWCPISMPLSPSDPRCWGSMHIYIGYFHPKYNFDIFHKNSKYEISSWTVYFYRARYLFHILVRKSHQKLALKNFKIFKLLTTTRTLLTFCVFPISFGQIQKVVKNNFHFYCVPLRPIFTFLRSELQKLLI